MRLLKEPLLLFLAVGAALFYVFNLLNPEQDDGTIIINDETLLTFIQYRSKVFDEAMAKTRWQSMSAAEQQQMLNDFLEEELLYREALALELEQDDYIIKRRLIQKMDFILQSGAESLPAPSDTELQSFMEKYAADYLVQPHITFAHVYFKNDDGSRAEATLPKLQGLGFSEAGEFGERFLYHRNYVERTYDYVAAHFGEAFAERIFALELAQASGQWLGPIGSEHGQHLVFISARVASYQPQLDEVRGRVLADYQRERLLDAKQTAVQALKQQHAIDGKAEFLQMLQLNPQPKEAP
ncbi:MAG: peptidylprolyl isomerase [Cellvibrionaceae bacterium]|nr:peptidylprolyl isomerase [Cellvibrionaceae bacterium]MCV6624698.1 peptidylprolyl isomerase [Cellvibrionaceae bacterium]